MAPHFLSPNEIVDDLLKNQLSSHQLKELKNVPEDELILCHHTFGMQIRNHYELWNPDNPHVDLFDPFSDKFPDQISQMIIEKMWKMLHTLQKYSHI